ncbi:hypothetical protein VUJ46_01640 [Chryseobacterium sp. MYb264]|uniref:hypothetical protein n=1 Tax=Chryseobacterium sp. MYb264 TaxID=2745153 RepID=UPI002E141FD8|nr:hypothetical protein VUJ46_01640 [Chryseobacterium sp. MYb264]
MRLYQHKIIIHLVCLVFIVLSCKDNKTPSSKNKKIESEINHSSITTVTSTIDTQNKNKQEKNNIDKKWLGTYTARFAYGQIGGINAGWDLEIKITNDQTIASGNGYQIGFIDELRAIAEGNRLILKHKENRQGYTLGEKMNPEFILIEDHGIYYVQSEWIDSDIITKPEAKGFKISKDHL